MHNKSIHTSVCVVFPVYNVIGIASLGFGIDFDSTTVRITIAPNVSRTEVCFPITIDDVQEDTEVLSLSIILDVFTPKNIILGPNSLVGGFIIG